MARILLADDDAATRDLVRRALAADGHDVVVTQDGTEALDSLLADVEGFKLLISDVDMPGLNGIELAAKAMAASPKLGVVLMTGLAEGTTNANRLGPGLRQFVTKPFTLEQIRSVVRKALVG